MCPSFDVAVSGDPDEWGGRIKAFYYRDANAKEIAEYVVKHKARKNLLAALSPVDWQDAAEDDVK